MNKILAFGEMQPNGSPKKGILELLTFAKKTGQAEVAGVLLGKNSKNAANTLAQYGASTVFCCDSDQLTQYNSQIYQEILLGIINQFQPQLLLASSSAIGRDLFARIASKLDTGISTDCTEIALENGKLMVRRPLYAGKMLASVQFKNSSMPIVLMRPNQLPVGNPTAGASTKVIEVALPSPSLHTIVKEVVKGTSQKLDLTEANIIVAGGRGMKEGANFKLLEELADVLGATVGASRAVVDAGWVPHSTQVGQTGKTVAPTLYFACGISGAIQHLAGMSASKVIVAINKDREAPIFKKATYGIVGDVLEILPKLTNEFKKIL